MMSILRKIIRLINRGRRVVSNSPRRTFKPKEFGETGSLFALGTMSVSYWDLAEEFKERAFVEIDSHKSGICSKYAFPSIIFYCSSVEALINESLSLKESQTTDQEIKQSIAAIRNGLDSNRDLVARVRNAYESLTRENTPTLGENMLQNYRALSEVRNAIVHYNPDFIDTHNWPIRLKEALKRSKVEPIMGDWTITFRTRDAIQWAYETSKNIVTEFLRKTKIDEAEFFHL